MRRATPVVLAVLLATLATGCRLPRLWPRRGQQEEQGTPVPETPELPERGALGLPKSLEERFEQPSVEDLQSDLARTRNGLSLFARTDKTAYKPDEPIMLDIRLENRSGTSNEPADKARDISVYFEPFAKTPRGKSAEWLFKFQIRCEKPERTIYRSPDFEVKEEDRADYYHFVNLPPQAYIGRRFILPPAQSRNWLPPGQYSIAVSYEASEEFPYVIINRHLTAQQVQLLGSKLAYVRVWTGKLFSNRTTFTIRPPRRWWWPF